MSARLNNTIDFASIIYNLASKDKDWAAEVIDTETGVKNVIQTTALETVLEGSGDYDTFSDLVGCSRAGAEVGDLPQAPAARYASNFSYIASGSGETLVLAMRLPLVKNICELTMLDNATHDIMQKAKNIRVYTSGRSDKVYHEITEWIKVFDTEMVASINAESYDDFPNNDASDENGLVLDTDEVRYPSSVLSSRNSDYKHARFFKSRAAWVKVEIDLVDSATVSLKQLGFHEYTGDPSAADPSISIVWPPNDETYLPSQTVYMTALIEDTDGDNCHFRFELYKETNELTEGVPDADSSLTEDGDLKVVTIDSNALNLDGTPNENYRREYFTLLDQSSGSSNVIHLSQKRTGCDRILIKPLKGANDETVFNLADVKVYRVGSDTPIYVDSEATMSAVLGSEVNIASATGSERAWMIDVGTAQDIIKLEFFHTTTVDENVQDFELYFSNSTSATSDPSDADWSAAGAKEIAWTALIEYCWPYEETDNDDGYAYDAVSETDNVNNPENNGKEGYATRVGDWRTVPAFSGLILNTAADGGGFYNQSDLTTGGDSPVTGVAKNKVYVRISLPDPYRNQEKYYFKPGVWDGQVKNP